MKNNNDLNKIYVSASYDENNNPWTIDTLTGILGRINKDTKSYIYASSICISESQYSDYHDVLEHNNRLFLLPKKFKSRPSISFLEMPEMSKKEICLADLTMRDNLKNNAIFTGMIPIGEYIYLIPNAYSSIVRIDTKDLSVTYIDKWKNEIDERIEKSSSLGYFCARQYVIKGDFLYVPFSIISAVLRINLITLEEEIININVKSQGFSCICKWDDCFLLSGAGYNKDWLYLWNENSGNIEKEWKLQETSDKYPVLKMLVSERGDAFIFPWQNWSHLDIDIYRLDHRDLKLKKLNLLSNHGDFREKKYLYGDEIINAHWIDNNRFLFVTGKDYKWHEYNIDTCEHIEYDVLFDEMNVNADNILREYCRTMASYSKPMNEDFGLKSFIKSII